MIEITENQESPTFHFLIGLNKKRQASFWYGLMFSNVFFLCHSIVIFRPTGRSNIESISSFDQSLLTDKELINPSSGIYPSTLTNVRFLEED